jgi:hypothetical protein
MISRTTTDSISRRVRKLSIGAGSGVAAHLIAVVAPPLLIDAQSSDHRVEPY